MTSSESASTVMMIFRQLTRSAVMPPMSTNPSRPIEVAVATMESCAGPPPRCLTW